MCSFTQDHREVLRGVFQHGHPVESGEVPNQLDKQAYISHTVEEVLVLEFFWLLVTQRLNEAARAVALAADDVVGDQPTILALHILHLVAYYPPVNHLDQSTLDLVHLQLLVTQGTNPRILKRLSHL